ncbi:Gfo/Idh/MocA family oxidoreductase [bacterium]|nr:Gfo/Idh/MocA family oxidoreductase [bacterium]
MSEQNPSSANGTTNSAGPSRRIFLKTSALAAAAMQLSSTGSLHAAGKDEIKVGVVGCGGRGSGATRDSLEADPGVKILAMADVFADRLKSNLDSQKTRFPDRVDVPAERQFIGFDGYKKLLECDLDYVIFATPPYFRAEQVEAAVQAGKHVFMEKPIGVDPVACKRIMAAGDLAAEKKLTVVTGTQRRHEDCYIEMIKRVRDGALGEILGGQVYWNQGQLWYKTKQEGWNDLEWMLKDWVSWRWLSGDHYVEQHVHNIDVMNWFKDGHPVRAVGSGGRAHRVTGDQYDYFAVDYEFADGSHFASYARQVNGCANAVEERVFGTKGQSYSTSNRAEIKGANEWKFRRAKKDFVSPYVQEHIDLIASIREGKGLNEARRIAESTLTAIMGREACYTGRAITWDEMMKSDMKLGPSETITWDIAAPEVKVPVAGTA